MGKAGTTITMSRYSGCEMTLVIPMSDAPQMKKEKQDTRADDSQQAVRGVVLVFIDEHGNAIAHAADFESQRPGGFTLDEAQRLRAKRQLALNVCNAYASPMLVRAVDVPGGSTGRIYRSQ